MARRRKKNFNLPKGNFGGFISKERLGTPYISSKPIRDKVKQTPELKKSKSIFGFFGKLTAELHADPKMRGMWEASDIKGENSRNQIMHINYRLVPDNRDLTNFRLSPFITLFSAPLIETLWEINKVTVTFGPFEGLTRELGYTAVSAHGVVRYYEFKSEGYESMFLIERVSSPPVLYVNGGQHTLTMEYDSDYTRQYNKRQFCFTLIIENRDGIAVECSENIIL